MCIAVITFVLITSDNTQLNEIAVSSDNIAFYHPLFLKVISTYFRQEISDGSLKYQIILET